MPPGIKYNMPPEVERELCNEQTIYRMIGGFDWDITGLPAGYKIPFLAPIKVTHNPQKAVLVKNVKVIEAVAVAATSIKIQKGSLIEKSMKLSDGEKVITVGSGANTIDTSNESFDLITVSALENAIEEGQVLTEATSATDATPKNVANKLNYERNKVAVAGQTLTAIGQAFEIKEKDLYLPISKWDKDSLGDLFMFI